MQTYREVIVRPDFRLTSQNPGQGHSVTEAVASRGQFSKTEPDEKKPLIVRRIAGHLHISNQQAEILFTDVQRFLWMAAQSPEACIPSPMIDDAWHEFMLYTREYEQFCQKYCGGFMHHEPHSAEETGPVDVAILQPTVDLMYRVFGKKPSDNWDYIPTKEVVAIAA